VRFIHAVAARGWAPRPLTDFQWPGLISTNRHDRLERDQL
jgi:hypothetical protein